MPIISLSNESPSLNPTQLSSTNIKNIIFNYFSIPADLVGAMSVSKRVVSEVGRVETYTVDFYDLTTASPKRNLRDYANDGNYRRFIFEVHRNGILSIDSPRIKSMVSLPEIVSEWTDAQLINPSYSP